ncbi:hypothetical protein HELRODRAFT_188772 [Helobdella robusta]|uniref:Inhibitor of growth protein n=1 Tax=Helobdella robusta TaxID=6412 RepID=T1FQC3_HELRO|nr:hypothetical protein HELRODRAFT_188772 [Helobdella robusta]ESO02605.1 hypothetical protein HELRODRAFT_188772 [Helobdella robusta]
MEMRDKFTEMREMDLQVSNTTDSLDEKVNQFFKRCSSNIMKQEWKDEQMAKIKQEYAKVLEDADEKVQLANQIYELVERHLRKLDQELSKFKMELEADNAGITEILERRTIESERSTPQFIGYHKPEIGSGSNAAIAVAASRAIGATVEMQQGRRTASLKASYEAVRKIPKLLTPTQNNNNNNNNINNNNNNNNINNNNNGGGGGSSSGAMLHIADGNVLVGSSKSTAKNKKHGGHSSSNNNSSSGGSSGTGNLTHRSALYQQQLQQQQQQHNVISSIDTANGGGGGDVVSEETSTGWHADPNEPRYCLCNDVSYGDMVGCDNEDCPLEWFHYGCVGLQQAPRGKWYCPQCLLAMKRRGRK